MLVCAVHHTLHYAHSMSIAAPPSCICSAIYIMHALCAWFNDYYRERIQRGSDNTRKLGQCGEPRINGSRLYQYKLPDKSFAAFCPTDIPTPWAKHCGNHLKPCWLLYDQTLFIIPVSTRQMFCCIGPARHPHPRLNFGGTSWNQVDYYMTKHYS